MQHQEFIPSQVTSAFSNSQKPYFNAVLSRYDLELHWLYPSKPNPNVFNFLLSPEEWIERTNNSALEYFDHVAVIEDFDDAFTEPNLKELLLQILNRIKKENIFISCLAEDVIMLGASLRESLDLPGPKIIDVQRFVDKTIMKEWYAREENISPRYEVVELAELCSLKDINTKLCCGMQYPVFAKLRMGSNCESVEYVQSREDMVKHAEYLATKVDSKEPVLLEEAVDAVEEYTATLLVKDKEVVRFVEITHDYEIVFNASRGAKRIAAYTLEFDCPEYLEIKEFTLKMFSLLQPVPDGIFNIQLMRERNTNHLYAFETAIRVTGYDIQLIAATTGINVELYQINAQLPKEVQTDCGLQKPMQYKAAACCSYLLRPGYLSKKLPRPETIKSQYYREIWWFGEGDCVDPYRANTADDLVLLLIADDDREIVRADLDFMVHKYEPFEISAEKPVSFEKDVN